MQKEGMKKAINILTVLCTAAMAAFVIYGVKSGIFTDRAMMEELVRNCDRIVVIQDGKKIGELAGGEMTEDAILRMLSTQEEKDGGNGR